MGWLKLLVSKARRWQQLDWEDKKILLSSWILLFLVNLSLRLLNTRRTQTILAQLSQCQTSLSPQQQLSVIAKITAMVDLASRYSCPWATCLRKSLVLWYLLRRKGIVSDLRIGIRRLNGEFQAHAWVEYQGRVLNDQADIRQHYAMFDQNLELTG